MNILKKEIPISLNLLYKVVAYLSITVFIITIGNLIVAKLNNDLETVTKLLVPLGVLLSAALASISVLKSIDNTNRIEKEKEKRDLYDKRLNVHNDIFEATKEIIQNDLTAKYAIHFNTKVSLAQFIFKPEIKNSLDLIYQDFINLSVYQSDIANTRKAVEIAESNNSSTDRINKLDLELREKEDRKSKLKIKVLTNLEEVMEQVKEYLQLT
jgi:hypothetical protein